MATGRFIRLHPETQARYQVNVVDGIRLRITVTDANLIPAKIFLHQLKPVAVGGTTRVPEFQAVCSPADLEEYPEDDVAPGANPPFFRRAMVDLVFRSQHDADAALAAIARDVGQLISTLDIMDNLVALPDLVIGTPPDPDTSSSSSESLAP